MKRLLTATALVLAFGVASLDADAARRFGGGGFLGKQRAVPTQRQATPPQQQTPPAQQAAPAQQPAKAPAANAAAGAAAKPGFMSRWGGLLAGLGIGALLASLFGAELGPIVGLLLAVMLGLGLAYLLVRLFAGNRATGGPAMQAGGPQGARPQFAGIGANVRREPGMNFEAAHEPPAAAASRSTAPALPPGFDVQAFQRVAKTSFIRLQAANDAGDLDDIRDYTTPEMYAEIAMQVKDRGGAAQRVEVVNVDAQLVDFATEGGHDYASVRFYGLLREEAGANPEPFDEIWHVRRRAGDKRDPWLIAGIQQVPA